jgi:hypothetical protein
LRILWAVSCREYHLHDDDTADIEGAGVNNFWVRSLPADLEAKVLVRLALHQDEEGVIETHFLEPQMTGAQSFDIDVRADPPREHVAGFEVHMTQPIEFQFEAAMEGTYSVELYMPDGRHESLFWVVRVGESPWRDL